MVLESLTNPLAAERNPKKMFFFGFLYSSIAILLSLWIFESNASLVMVFLTTIAAVPIIYNTMQLEEQKDETIEKEWVLLKEHSRALSFFVWLFIGMVVSMTLWFILLPESITQSLFSVQLATISKINTVTGSAISTSIFSKILFNNLQVLVFAIIFSFLYGVGAIFILTWNASVIAAAMGTFISTGVAGLASAVGIGKAIGYSKVVFMSVIRYSIHGIPEILAYFAGGLAAGIISVAVLRHGIAIKIFKKVIKDSTNLFLISIALLIIAALLEVFVTPIFF